MLFLYCGWVIAPLFGEEEGPQLGDVKCKQWRAERKEKGGYVEATKPVMSGGPHAWWICSQEWGAVGGKPGRVGWDQTAGARKVNPPRGVSF